MIRNTKELVGLAFLAAIVFASQVALSFLPNIEVVSLLLIIYTLVLGRKTIIITYVFVILEGLVYGMGFWWMGYLIIWPLLVLLTWKLKSFLEGNYTLLAIYSAAFGLIFGALYAIPYIFINNFQFAVLYWIRGIPFDLLHMLGNYFTMLVLGQPVCNVISRGYSKLAKYN